MIPPGKGRHQNTGGNPLPATIDTSISTYIIRAAAIHTARLIWRSEHFGWPRLSAPITISNPRVNPDGGKGATGHATLLEKQIIISTDITLKIKCSRTDYVAARETLTEALQSRVLEYIATPYPERGPRVIPTPHDLTPWIHMRPFLGTLQQSSTH